MPAMAEENLQPELRRLWRIRTGSRLGRPSELDVDTVVRQAVALADRDGLAAVTLPKVATALGYTPMSLYRHVGSKDELFALMEDHALGPAPGPTAGAGDEGWRPRLRRWATAQAAVYRRHPWLLRLPLSGPPRGPNRIGWLDAGLRALRDTGLGWGAKVGILNVLGGYVRTACQLEQDLWQGRNEAGDRVQAEREYGRVMAGLVGAERFPDAAQLFASGLFDPASPRDADRPDGDPASSDFGYGLELILDGVAAAIPGGGPHDPQQEGRS